MGSLIGGLIGGVGSMVGASAQASAAREAAQTARLGYDYLTTGAGADESQAYLNAGVEGLNSSSNVQNMMAQLLGAQAITDDTSNAFNQYKDSTGYQFQLEAGNDAITASQATSGALRSGATSKALAEYGQNLGATTFNNYLTQLSGLNSANLASAQLGQNQLSTIAGIGTTAGANAANSITDSGNALASGYSSLFTNLGTGIGSLF